MANEFGHGENAAVYLNLENAEAVLDESDRRESVFIRFHRSRQLNQLNQLAEGVSPKQLTRILVTSLAGCVTNEDFLKIVRQVQFDTMRETKQTNSHSKESLGRKVEKSVAANAGEVPEFLNVNLPMIRPIGINTSQQIRCAVLIDIDAETIALIPIGSEMDNAEQKTLAVLHDAISPGTTASCFGGKTNIGYDSDR